MNKDSIRATRRIQLVIITIACLSPGPIVIQAQDSPPVSGLGQRPIVNRITGRVTDKETNEPLLGVHVFYAGTTIGDISDEEGRFDLLPPPVQQMDLVFSMIGYEMNKVGIDLRGYVYEPLEVAIKPSTFALSGVSVIGDLDHEWRSNLRRFEDIIFGDTEFGDHCTMVNPEVLDLSYQSIQDDLTAIAREPLVILNPDLGYQIEIHQYELHGRERLFTWKGQPVFRELEAENERQRESWKKNRMKAFHGSMRHFLIALNRNALKEEGFGAYHVSAIGFKSLANPIAELRGDDYDREEYHPILTGNPDDETRLLELFGTLLVIYNKEPEPFNYVRYSTELRDTAARAVLQQSSWIQIPFGSITVDPRGNIIQDSVTYPVKYYGYWGWERVGEWLPADFEPTD
jgi:hypothetical protein